MPRVNRLQCEIVTGDMGLEGDVVLAFNGHPLTFEGAEGGAAAGETFTGSFSPRSVAHSVTLVGPEDGEWSIDSITVTYELDIGEPYVVRYGAITLDESNQVNIWAEPPRPTFDV